MNIAVNAARPHETDKLPGSPTLLITPATSEIDVANRLVSSEGRVDTTKLNSGFLSAQDWSKLTQSAQFLSGLPLTIDDRPQITIASLASKMAAFAKQAAVGARALVVVDYVQMIRSDPRRQNRYEELCDASRELKCLAREHDLALLVISQLNRNIESRVGVPRMPRLTDLRDSGTLEDDADAVILLPDDDAELPGYDTPFRHAVIAKNRFGRTAKVPLRFDKAFARWDNDEGPEEGDDEITPSRDSTGPGGSAPPSS